MLFMLFFEFSLTILLIYILRKASEIEKRRENPRLRNSYTRGTIREVYTDNQLEQDRKFISKNKSKF